MQDGVHKTQFEITTCTGQATRVGSSNLPESCGNETSLFNVPPSLRRPCPGMPYSSEPWSCGSIPLSIFSNGGSMNTACSQLGHARNPSPSLPETSGGGIERGAVTSCSNLSNSSALKERDYIGLSDSSSTSSKSSFTLVAPVEQLCSNPGLDCKDTDLRLGLGLSLGRQGEAPLDEGRSVPSEQRSTNDIRSECSSLEHGTPNACITEKSPRSEVKRVSDSSLLSGKTSAGESASEKNGSVSKFSERVLEAQLHGAVGSHLPQPPGSSKSRWNDKPFLNQRSSTRPQSFVENQNSAVQERYGNQQLSVPSRLVKENNVGLSAKHVLPVDNCLTKDGASLLSNDLSRLEASFGRNHVIGSYEFRFAPHNLLASGERNANTLHSPQQWPKVLPNDNPRSSFQTGNMAEFDSSNKTYEALPQGMLIFPVPNSTVPAKRPYIETIGESIMINCSESRSETRANVGVVGASGLAGINPSSFAISNKEIETKPGVAQTSKVHPVSGLFPWNNVIQQPVGRPIGAEQTKGLFSPNIPASPASLPRVQAPSQLKASSAGVEQTTDTPAPAFPVKQTNNDDHANSQDVCRTQVVGWPPIRSFRKNTLASQKRLKDQEQEPPANPHDAVEQVKQPPSPSLFVKANMDGVPIGRKVDLTAYDSYESLKSALQDMFQRFMNGPMALGMACASNADNKQLNLLDGTEYVLTHEDKDGDWMLVGDVPWNMFVTTVKRLRIMKVSEAIGLGSKLKVQLDNNPVEGARGK